MVSWLQQELAELCLLEVPRFLETLCLPGAARNPGLYEHKEVAAAAALAARQMAIAPNPLLSFHKGA